MRLINADELMPKLKFIREAEHQIYGKESWEFASKCITAIEDAPTIEERKTGKWIPHKSVFGGLGEKVYTCNQCGYNIGFHTENFCPSCGADMREGQDERHD